MRRPWLLLLLALGCGARASAPPRSEPEAASERAPDEAPASEPPSLAWTEGSDRFEVRSIAVAFRVRAPIARFAPDELGTATCGDRLVHAVVVDRRSFEPSEAVLWRTFLRAGCAMPDEVSVSELVVEGDEIRADVSFETGEVAGAWRVRASTLRRAHRVVVVVSAARPDVEGALFVREVDAPGLETVGSPPPDRHEDDSARDAVEMVFGVLGLVGEIFRGSR